MTCNRKCKLVHIPNALGGIQIIPVWLRSPSFNQPTMAQGVGSHDQKMALPTENTCKSVGKDRKWQEEVRKLRVETGIGIHSVNLFFFFWWDWV
jgi:hypothetical protein